MSFMKEILDMQEELREVRGRSLATDTEKLELLMKHAKDMLRAIGSLNTFTEQLSEKVDRLLFARGESMSPEQLSMTIRELTGRIEHLERVQRSYR